MSVWLIQPRDPLIFRDGKPFNATPGAQATSLPFPYPSTLAGGVRTRAGTDETGWFDPKQSIDKLLQLNIRGPILVAIDEDGEVDTWYFPAPTDCLLVESGDKSQGQRYWIHPVKPPDDAETNLKQGCLVSPNPVVKQKPHKKAPAFWNWGTMQTWLTQPANDAESVDLSKLGISGLTQQSRVHVRIDAETGTASEGFLFQTSGLEFFTTPQGENGEASHEENRKMLSKLRQYALAVETDAALQSGVDFLGGERRVVNWVQSSQTFPVCPDEIRQAIIAQKHCRLLLTTPAIFKQDYLPKWVCKSIPDLTVNIVAAAVPRYRAVSGWDAKERTQKRSRRLAPAGSVYFLSLDGDAEATERFIDTVWMNSVSDDKQDRRDGFGLALLGIWDGEIKALEVKE
jgi:CRISPR-associated protein Cmr3